MQPGAFDKSLLFYLSYKSAYEYWNEERRTLNNEVRPLFVSFLG